LYEIFFAYNIPPPRVLAYDDACHLLKYLQNREDRSDFAKWLLAHVKFVVDRFHWLNHKGSRVPNCFCALNVNPHKCAELGPKANTEAAEQVSFRCRYKSMRLVTCKSHAC
jgi:hypothetical protein